MRETTPSGSSLSRSRLPYDWMFVAFGIFIVACGATHAMGIWTIWEPRYWLEGGIKAVTAAASIATAIALPPLIPRALEMVREARESDLRRAELEEAHQEQEELVERLREADEARTRFFANVSHDLRTPLSLILGPVQEMLEEDLPEEHRERLGTVLRNARTLDGQVEDLLTVARMEAGALDVEPRPVDLAAVVREVADHFLSHARGRKMDFRVETPEALVTRADPDLLERAVLNLLSNAFEYTPDGGSVRCVIASEDEEGVRITVADSGPGIPEEERDAVFERFRRGGSGAEARPGGAGLGLAIVRDVAEAHEGAVEMGRSSWGGSEVTLRLPSVPTGSAGDGDGQGAGPAAEVGAAAEAGARRAEPVEAPPSEVRRPEVQERGPTDAPLVLLVEDDPDMRGYLSRVLAAEHRVVPAADGAEGLRRAEERRPDLIVTDVMMPEMSGPELVEALREREALADVPVLVLTARADEELPERMLRSGAQDYVLKPVSRGELMARVQNLLDLTRSRRLLQEELSTDEQSLEALVRTEADRKHELERTVEEKKVLMRELHHRVKGNLQTVTSLLQYQLRGLEDERARRPLEESRGRVAAMGLLHEKLYRSGAPDRVELSGYFRSLVSDVARTRATASEVRVRLEIEELEVEVDDAVACGLIVHELVTNALRHGFPEDAEEGTVRVSLRTGDGRATLVVADDGAGLGSTDGGPGEAMGLELVESLVEQLDGRMEVREDDGTRVEVVFPVRETEREDGEDRIEREGGR